MIRLAHVWSSDMGLAHSIPHVRHLIDRGWEVYGICPPGPRVAAAERAGIRWMPHPIERKLNPVTDALGFRTLYDAFREHRFHIVHTHAAKTGILARWAAAAARVPVIVHTHHGLIFSLGSRPAFRFAAALLERSAHEVADRAFVQSQDDYDCLLKTYAAKAEMLELIGNGIDINRFSAERFDDAQRNAIRAELGVDADDVLFFSAGRLVSEKGYVELFEAYAAVHRENANVRLAIAGPHDDERGFGLPEDVLAEARANGALLLGERTDMERLYAASDIVVLPSWREGIARVLIEGAAMGKPLIASDARGCRNVVRPGWGLLTPVRDPGKLAEAMRTLANDRELRTRIGAHNVLAARKEYDLKGVLARVDAVYAELLNAKGIKLASPDRVTLSAA